MSKQICIIGCGWLGFPLAKHLIKKQFRIKGSTTSEKKLIRLLDNNIDGYVLKLSNDTVEGDIEACLSNSDVLILNIPPSFRKNPNADYVKRIALLIPFIEQSLIKKVLFISTTSVYSNHESIPIITEDTASDPELKSGKQLLKAEQLFQKNKHFETTILRFSGLFGPDRHPATFLSGKTNLKNPFAPVNLVHLKDCIGIILSIIEQDIWSETFNIATTDHPLRKDYYTSICKDLKLAIPEFNIEEPSMGKLINSEKLVRILEYTFKVNL